LVEGARVPSSLWRQPQPHNTMPYLSIVTRHYTKRPGLYAHMLESIQAQTCRDFEHVVIVDEIGIGVPAANKQLAERDWSDLTGEYVYMLDDDATLARSAAIADLQHFTNANNNPEMVILRADLLYLGVLPYPWNYQPIHSHIDLGCVALRRDLFLKSIASFGDRYAGDFDYIDAAYKQAGTVAWYDCLFMRAQKISHGAAE
jgi:hypothetical protein